MAATAAFSSTAAAGVPRAGTGVAAVWAAADEAGSGGVEAVAEGARAGAPAPALVAAGRAGGESS